MSNRAAPAGAPAPSAAPLAPGTLLQEYRVRRVLGTGGFGITYEAQDPNLDKIVAIKEYLPSELAVRAANNSVSVRSDETREGFNWGRDEFLKEARVLARFNHPSLIHVYRFFEANNTAYFVMEYAEGQTMDAILMKEGVLPEARVRQMLLPILDGLTEVHRARVLHRDIKPSNMIVRKDGQAILIDFGSAKQDVSSMTQSMMSVVTPGYAPVEQYSVDGHQGPWTDIYALGAVCYRAITGKRPIESVNRLQTDALKPAVEVGAGKYSINFLRAVDWALAVQPGDRPVGIADWRMAIEGVIQAPSRDGRTPVRPDPASDADADDATKLLTVEPARPPTVPARAATPASSQPTSRPMPAEVPDWQLMEDKPTAAEQAAAAQALARAAQKVIKTHADPAGVWHRPLPPKVVRTVPPAASAPELALAPDAAASPPASAPPAPALDSAPVPAPSPKSTPAPASATPAAPAPGSTPAAAEPRKADVEGNVAAAAAQPPRPAASRKKLVLGAAVAAGVLVLLVVLLMLGQGNDETAAGTTAGAAPRKPAKRVEAPQPKAGPVLDPKASVAVNAMSALSTFRDCDVCPAMIALPPGGFLMGSPPEMDASEQPEHRVTFETPFAVGAREVRNAEWQACVDAGACPAASGAGDNGAGDLPVVNVSRREAELYTAWLSQLTKRKYRLPTESEWEYAARADSTGPWFWGQAGLQCTHGNGADRSAKDLLGPGATLATCVDGQSSRAPVGSFQANDFGLYDTAGNVWEWQGDCWREDYAGAPAPPDAAVPCERSAVRGGSFRSPPAELRSAARQGRGSDERADDLGFRVLAE